MSDPRDTEFHDEDLSALYRVTRDPEPPAWLDQRILTAANATPQPVPTLAPSPSRRRRTRLWAVPAALAATVVLAVGIVRLARESGEWGPLPENKTLHSTAESAAEADATAAGRAQFSDHDRPSSSAVELRPTMPLGEAVRVAPQSLPALPAAAPPVKLEQELMPRRTAPAERERPQDWLRAAPTGQRVDQDAASQDRSDRYSPEEWLAVIAELRHQGRTAEADAELAEFRRRYPDYPLEAAPEPPR
ncbi:MAG TPA: hypothetical protein P5032_07240 [Candidatus Competibacter sp.]|nr:hypothetical protein [Candidatus Competibacteraceae bacterium]HRW65529.1 hypothetical protein [Candidatus Competibacter sp.]